MRRRTAHLAFGAVSLAFAVMAGFSAVRLRDAEHVNAEILAASGALADREGRSGGEPIPGGGARAGSGAPSGGGARSRSSARASGDSHSAGRAIFDSAVPEARFAQALALARQGDYEHALDMYRALGHTERGPIALAALYNAGNLHLREALKAGPDGAARSLPLIELAKQSYRSVLRRDPQAWDARYNLERALWLAPEIEEPAVDTIKRDAEHHVMSTLQGTRGDLP